MISSPSLLIIIDRAVWAGCSHHRLRQRPDTYIIVKRNVSPVKIKYLARKTSCDFNGVFFYFFSPAVIIFDGIYDDYGRASSWNNITRQIYIYFSNDSHTELCAFCIKQSSPVEQIFWKTTLRDHIIGWNWVFASDFRLND